MCCPSCPPPPPPPPVSFDFFTVFSSFSPRFLSVSFALFLFPFSPLPLFSLLSVSLCPCVCIFYLPDDNRKAAKISEILRVCTLWTYLYTHWGIHCDWFPRVTRDRIHTHAPSHVYTLARIPHLHPHTHTLTHTQTHNPPPHTHTHTHTHNTCVY